MKKDTSPDTANQRRRVVALLQAGPKTSHDLREAGIYWPAGRVRELRKRGWEISTALVTLWDANGYMHPRCALYELHAAPQDGQEVSHG